MFNDALALNPQGLDSLRWQAKQDGGKESVRAAAQQFESYFLQMMLRTMRQTLTQDGPFDSQETRMFSDMFDQQVSQSIAKTKGLGLADMLVEQLQYSMAAEPVAKVSPRPYDLPPLTMEDGALPSLPQMPPLTMPGASQQGGSLTQRNFVDSLWPHAVDAAAEIGVSPHLLVAQAALETGWGKRELRTADGSNSYNLFNIKAGKSWQGEVATSETTEYVNGKPLRETAQFRAYNSYAESFADYARLIKNSPRYAGAVAQGGNAEGFARGLQSGGYATDPMYADKILRVLNSATFRNGMSLASADIPG